MTIIKTALVAASLVFAVTAANAQSREELNTRIHGNTEASVQSISQQARGSFAQSDAVRAPVTTTNPLIDMFHG